MPDWVVTLLVKPFVALLLFCVVFALPIVLVRAMQPYFPGGRLKDFLFRERGANSSSRPAHARERVLDQPAITGRKVGEDRPRL